MDCRQKKAINGDTVTHPQFHRRRGWSLCSWCGCHAGEAEIGTVRKIPNKQKSREQKVKCLGSKLNLMRSLISFISALYVAHLVAICAATCKSNSEAVYFHFMLL